jgi:hypothetical protein
MKLMLLILGGLTTVFLTGCGTVFGASHNYDLAVKNIGKEEVWCSLVASVKGIAHEPGRVIPGADKTFAGPFKHPYADKWTVTWKTAKGKEITKILDLANKFPKRFAGRLVFTIDAENNLSYVTETFSGK